MVLRKGSGGEQRIALVAIIEQKQWASQVVGKLEWKSSLYHETFCLKTPGCMQKKSMLSHR